MGNSAAKVLAGTLLVDDATGTRATGSAAVYKSDGSIDQAFTAASRASSGLGGVTSYLRITEFKNSDGTVLDATGGANKFKVSSTPGTSFGLLSETSTGAVKTDTASIEGSLSQFYNAGDGFSVVLDALYTNTTGTMDTHTVTGALYRIAADGTEGSDLIAATQTLTTSAALYTFAVAGSNAFVPGDRFWLSLVGKVAASAGTGTITYSSVALK